MPATWREEEGKQQGYHMQLCSYLPEPPLGRIKPFQQSPRLPPGDLLLLPLYQVLHNHILLRPQVSLGTSLLLIVDLPQPKPAQGDTGLLIPIPTYYIYAVAFM